MADIKISALPSGTPKGTDLTPATDTTDTSSAATGTTKKYVRSDEFNFYVTAMGVRTLTACRLGTAAALTATYANGVSGVGATLTNSGAMAALTIDGVAVAVADRILVKNQAAQAQNGIYTVTTIGSGAVNWVLTRATDYDQAADVQQFDVVLVNQGTVNAGLAYQESNAGPFTMGTTDIIFILFNVNKIINPSPAVANKLLRSDGTNWVVSTNASMDASDVLSGLTQLNVDNLRLDGNTISSTDANGNVNLIPNGSGIIVLNSSTTFTTKSLGVVQVLGTGAQSGDFALGTFGPTNGPALNGFRSRNTTPGSFTVLNSGYNMLTLRSYGDDGTQLLRCGLLEWQVDGAPSAGIVPSKLIIQCMNAAGASFNAFVCSSAGVITLPSALPVTSGGTGLITIAANRILYSSALDTISSLATVNFGLLGANGTGVPSFSTSLGGDFTFNTVKIGLGANSQAHNTALGAGGVLSSAAVGGDFNSCFGYQTGSGITSGTYNTLLAYNAGAFVTTGTNNTLIGASSGWNLASGGANLTTGTFNTCVGFQASTNNAATAGAISIGADAIATIATGATNADDGPGIAIGSAAYPVGFRGDATIYPTAGAISGYAKVKWNGTFYKIALYALS